jgi:nucleoside-diphosphate-sugar epimerase
MRVFVTGATGFIGSAVVKELKATGHEVLGLARNDASADALKAIGVAVHRGDLTDTASLVAGAKACDGVIHTAFVHDFTKFAENIETDRRAVEAMAASLEGSNKPLVIASGTLMVARDGLATETDSPADPNGPRAASETIVLGAAARGVRGAVVRLPPTVHGAGDKGFIQWLVDAARRHGGPVYIGEGKNHWPAVHRLDAARVFCLAVEKAPAGTALHAVAEEGVELRTIAEAIGAGLGLPARSVTAEEAGAVLEFLAWPVSLDNRTSSARTREMLGWTPTGPDLLTDIRDAGYLTVAA